MNQFFLNYSLIYEWKEGKLMELERGKVLATVYTKKICSFLYLNLTKLFGCNNLEGEIKNNFLVEKIYASYSKEKKKGLYYLDYFPENKSFSKDSNPSSNTKSVPSSNPSNPSLPSLSHFSKESIFSIVNYDFLNNQPHKSEEGWCFNAKKLISFEGHSSGIKHFSHFNEKYMVSASKDSTVRFWEIDCSSCLSLYQAHKQAVNHCCFLESHLIASSDLSQIHLWNPNQSLLDKPLLLFSHLDSIHSLSSLPHSNLLYAGSGNPIYQKQIFYTISNLKIINKLNR